MLGALAVLFYLARRLYNLPIAVATVLVLLFMLPQMEIHPIIVGRQVLGEMPAMFYLLTGYALFLLALENCSDYQSPSNAVLGCFADRTTRDRALE